MTPLDRYVIAQQVVEGRIGLLEPAAERDHPNVEVTRALLSYCMADRLFFQRHRPVEAKGLLARTFGVTPGLRCYHCTVSWPCPDMADRIALYVLAVEQTDLLRVVQARNFHTTVANGADHCFAPDYRVCTDCQATNPHMTPDERRCTE